jgi:hypothetical protein
VNCSIVNRAIHMHGTLRELRIRAMSAKVVDLAPPLHAVNR